MCRLRKALIFFVLSVATASCLPFLRTRTDADLGRLRLRRENALATVMGLKQSLPKQTRFSINSS